MLRVSDMNETEARELATKFYEAHKDATVANLGYLLEHNLHWLSIFVMAGQDSKAAECHNNMAQLAKILRGRK